MLGFVSTGGEDELMLVVRMGSDWNAGALEVNREPAAC